MGNAVEAWNGYLAFFFFILANRIGVPLPATPVLLAAGALSGLGQLKFPVVLGLAIVATVLSDSVWYELGRRHGGRVLNFLCRWSLEPDDCIRRAEGLITRYGARSLLVSKFIPGANRATLPLTGLSRVSFSRFLAFDLVGAALWASGYAGLGYVFSEEIERAVRNAPVMSLYVIVALAIAAAAYVLAKYLHRRFVLQQLAVDRITPQELKARLVSGEPLTVLDLRHPLEVAADSCQIPGAVHIAPEELEHRRGEIPREHDVILYCT